MITLIRLLRSNKQVLELFCLIVSVPLVWINVELHLSKLYPSHSSVAAMINYRRVRELSFDKLENVEIVGSSNRSQAGTDRDFDAAFSLMFSQEIEARYERVATVCRDHKEELEWSREDLEWHMKHKNLWDVIHRVVFCPIAKVASTSWFMNFLEMAGVKLEDIDVVMEQIADDLAKTRNSTANWKGEAGGRGIRALAKYIYQPPAPENLTHLITIYNKMTGFFMVRHPFVRLVSAYEDKMLNPHPFPFGYHHKIQEIIKTKRKNRDKKINFPKDLLNSVRYRQMLRNKLITLAQLSKQPSFSEFVSWLITDRSGKDGSYKSWFRDNTWLPYHAICPVCQSKFSILKLDTDKNEMQNFIEEQKLPIKKTAKIHTKGGARNSAVKADRYFSSLTVDQVKKLSEIYKYDFQMFDYEYDDYLQLAELNSKKKKNEFDLAFEKVRQEEENKKMETKGKSIRNDNPNRIKGKNKSRKVYPRSNKKMKH